MLVLDVWWLLWADWRRRRLRTRRFLCGISWRLEGCGFWARASRMLLRHPSPSSKPRRLFDFGKIIQCTSWYIEGAFIQRLILLQMQQQSQKESCFRVFPNPNALCLLNLAKRRPFMREERDICEISLYHLQVAYHWMIHGIVFWTTMPFANSWVPLHELACPSTVLTKKTCPNIPSGWM